MGCSATKAAPQSQVTWKTQPPVQSVRPQTVGQPVILTGHNGFPQRQNPQQQFVQNPSQTIVASPTSNQQQMLQQQRILQQQQQIQQQQIQQQQIQQQQMQQQQMQQQQMQQRQLLQQQEMQRQQTLVQQKPMTPMSTRIVDEIKAVSRPTSSGRSSVVSSNEPPMKMTKEVLSRFISLEYELKTLLEANPLKKLEQAKEEVVDLEKTMAEKKQKFHEAQQKALKEASDVKNVEQYFRNNQDFDSIFQKEQDEYLEAMNVQEIAKKELDLTQQHLTAKTTLVDLLQRKSRRFLEVQLQHDKMMASIFGDYGSSEEERLEAELDALEDRKQRIAVANDKWHTSTDLVKQATARLYAAVQNWHHLSTGPQDQRHRFYYAHQTRQQLVLAMNSLSNSHSLLSTIAFPYCTPDEVKTLNLAIHHIFTDMMTADRYRMAYTLYYTTYQRSAALQGWIKHVLDARIAEDFKNAVEAYKEKETELRAERLTLMKNKVELETNERVDLDVQMTAKAITETVDTSTEMDEIERLEAAVMAIGNDETDSVIADYADIATEIDDLPAPPETIAVAAEVQEEPIEEEVEVEVIPVTPIEGDTTTEAEDEADAADERVDATDEGVDAADEGVDATDEGVDAADDGVDAAVDGVDDTVAEEAETDALPEVDKSPDEVMQDSGIGIEEDAAAESTAEAPAEAAEDASADVTADQIAERPIADDATDVAADAAAEEMPATDAAVTDGATDMAVAEDDAAAVEEAPETAAEPIDQVPAAEEEIAPAVPVVVAAPAAPTPPPPPPPKQLEDIAPPPTQEDLFGNIDALKRQHIEQVNQFQRAQEMNKARLDQGLQERLAARRSRKARQEQHEKELAALAAMP